MLSIYRVVGLAACSFLLGSYAITLPAASAATLPPNLAVLEQKMGEVKISSLRFSEKTSISVPHSERKLVSLLKLLLGGGISGEVAMSPPAGNLVIDLFGHPLELRVVGKTTYLYLRPLGRVDRGRPWVRLGRGGFAELVTINGKHIKAPKASPPKIGEPALAEPPFEGLRKALAGAQEVRELGTSTVDGQPVTNFLAVLAPGELKHEQLTSSPGLVAASAATTFEVSLAQDGLPVRMVIIERDAGTVVTVTLDIPVINFPLTITAPPASKTISVAALRALERQSRRSKKKH